jgi:hypothetical protein
MNTQPSVTPQLQDTSMAIQSSDRRVAPRFGVQFRTFLTDQHSMSEHMGDPRLIRGRLSSGIPCPCGAVSGNGITDLCP